jgi:hypothetical protein
MAIRASPLFKRRRRMTGFPPTATVAVTCSSRQFADVVNRERWLDWARRLDHGPKPSLVGGPYLTRALPHVLSPLRTAHPSALAARA